MKLHYTFDELESVVTSVSEKIKHKKIITFTGMLGAGKTTTIRQLLRTWGVTQGVTSPTFTYMNQYVTPEGIKIFHFDLYRIATVDEFIALGFDEYLYKDGCKVLIEWPEVIAPLLAGQNVAHINLRYDEATSDKRTLEMSDIFSQF